MTRRGRARPAPDVHSVTTVRVSAAEERHQREVRYLMAMSFRVMCFILALVISGPLRWVAVAFAVFLPWVAVLIANNRGNPRHVRVDPGARGLGTSSGPSAAGPPSSSPVEPVTTAGEVISGTIHLPSAPDSSRPAGTVQDVRHTGVGLPSGGFSEKDR